MSHGLKRVYRDGARRRVVRRDDVNGDKLQDISIGYNRAKRQAGKRLLDNLWQV